MKDGKLTHKQQVFIDEYLKSFNATAAAKAAGYSPRSAHQMGWENLKHPVVAEAIQQRLADVHMSADEALKLTADIARGDIAELLDDNGTINIGNAKARGLSRLIKKLKYKRTDQSEETEIELYNAQDAIRDILKVHGKFMERVDLTTGGEKIKGYIGISPEDWDKQEDAEK